MVHVPGAGKEVCYIAVGQSSIAPATLPMTIGRLGAAWEPIVVKMEALCLVGTCEMESDMWCPGQRVFKLEYAYFCWAC